MSINRLSHAGLRFGWLDFEDEWNHTGVDTNWQWIDALLLGVVTDAVNTLPGNPVAGAFYIVNATGGVTNPGQLALWVIALDEAGVQTGSWDYLSPSVGMRVYNATAKTYLRWSGTAWVADLPVSVSFFAGGERLADEMIAKLLSPVPMTVPSAAPGSFFSCESAPAANYQILIKKNGSQVGSINFLAGATQGSITTTGFSLEPGNALTFHAPTVVDEDFASLSVTINAVRRLP
jgi:hypothetical protein